MLSAIRKIPASRTYRVLGTLSSGGDTFLHKMRSHTQEVTHRASAVISDTLGGANDNMGSIMDGVTDRLIEDSISTGAKIAEQVILHLEDKATIQDISISFSIGPVVMSLNGVKFINNRTHKN